MLQRALSSMCAYPVSAGSICRRELIRTEASITIIFITGHGDIPMAVRAIKEGAVDFLAKPFRDQDLIDAEAAPATYENPFLRAA
jgi:FixJ family two-component response regulator